MTNQVQPETRQRAVEAARQLFWERGYESTALADVAERAKVNAGSLYYFFRSKEQLLLAVLDLYVDMLYPAVIAPALERTSDPVERIFALLNGYREGLLITGFAGGCPIGNLALEVADALPRAREKIAQNFTNWRGWVEKFALQAGSRLGGGVAPRELAAFVLAVMEGAVMQSRAYRSIEPFDAAVGVLRDYFHRLETKQAGTKGIARA